ncbi:MAG: hypothetical protein UHS41_03805 [Lachnospiraceae bacterium]|nr:hypothetical protein [Lachnospiraceae bacterium]
MITITKIIGNAMCCCSGGCHNTDFVNIIIFSDGTSLKVNCCTCGNGCHGSFPINHLTEGMTFNTLNSFYEQFPAAKTAAIS